MLDIHCYKEALEVMVLRERVIKALDKALESPTTDIHDEHEARVAMCKEKLKLENLLKVIQ